MSKTKTTDAEERGRSIEEGDALTTFTDDEAFVLCLLFMVQVAYRRGEAGRTTQHVVAFLAQWDEMGTGGRNEMGDKISKLARELGYPERAQELVERKAKAELQKDISDEDLPEPQKGVSWN